MSYSHCYYTCLISHLNHLHETLSIERNGKIIQHLQPCLTVYAFLFPNDSLRNSFVGFCSLCASNAWSDILVPSTPGISIMLFLDSFGQASSQYSRDYNNAVLR